MHEGEIWQQRTRLLIGKEKLEVLKDSHVLVVGLGGVGSWAAEMICRAGVGNMTIADGDTIHPSNRNRQLLALVSTEKEKKALLMRSRLLDINPKVNIIAIDQYLKDDALTELVQQAKYDYVVDAIDTLAPSFTSSGRCWKRVIRW
jgi:tRNA threonylcarbamoyladenosine dehydratase